MKQLIDRQLYDLNFLRLAVEEENQRQLLKWGVQTHTPFEWLAYLVEEVGELSEAISETEYRDGKTQHVIDEAIQVATLALKIAEMYLWL